MAASKVANLDLATAVHVVPDLQATSIDTPPQECDMIEFVTSVGALKRGLIWSAVLALLVAGDAPLVSASASIPTRPAQSSNSPAAVPLRGFDTRTCIFPPDAIPVGSAVYPNSTCGNSKGQLGTVVSLPGTWYLGPNGRVIAREPWESLPSGTGGVVLNSPPNH
jgi:hypothetical protein